MPCADGCTEHAMARAEQELRELRRELLLARGKAEREMLAGQLDRLESRSRSGVAGLVLSGAQRAKASGLLGVAMSAVRVARAQPWLIPAVAGGVAKLARSRTLRWVALAGAVAAAVWWLRQRPRTVPSNPMSGEPGPPPADDPSGD
jgi:hypothetical protein